MNTVEIAAYFPNTGSTVSSFSKGAVFVLKTANGKHRKVFTYKAKRGINVRKEELEALLECVKLVKNPEKVILYTNSVFIYKALTEWIAIWQSNGWLTCDKQPVKHRFLWEQISDLMRKKRFCISLSPNPSYTLGGSSIMDEAYLEFINLEMETDSVASFA